LYGAEKITRSFIKNDMLPEEIVHLHIQALRELYPQIPREVQHAMNFLIIVSNKKFIACCTSDSSRSATCYELFIRNDDFVWTRSSRISNITPKTIGIRIGNCHRRKYARNAFSYEKARNG